VGASGPNWGAANGSSIIEPGAAMLNSGFSHCSNEAMLMSGMSYEDPGMVLGSGFSDAEVLSMISGGDHVPFGDAGWGRDVSSTSESESSTDSEAERREERERQQELLRHEEKRQNVNNLLEQMQEDAMQRREEREEGGCCSLANLLWIGIFILGAYMFYKKVIYHPDDDDDPTKSKEGALGIIHKQHEKGAEGQHTCLQIVTGACGNTCKSCCVSCAVCCTLITTVTCVMFRINAKRFSECFKTMGDTVTSVLDQAAKSGKELMDTFGKFLGDACPCGKCCCNGNTGFKMCGIDCCSGS